MRILLTGAAGRIGTAFYRETAGRYWFRLADRNTSNLASRGEHDVVTLDITDLDACRAACAGIDAVLHLAADPSPAADFYGSLLDNNIKGTYNVFRAAKDAGVRRVIFASSIHAVAGYPEETPIPIDVSVRPLNMYGVSKCFGEAVAAYFAAAEGLSTIAVRIGAYDAPWIRDDPNPRALSAYVSPRDLNHLFVRALEAPPQLRHAIVAGQSNNRIQRLDLAETRRVLGYDPEDDGFALAGVEPSPQSRLT